MLQGRRGLSTSSDPCGPALAPSAGDSAPKGMVDLPEALAATVASLPPPRVRWPSRSELVVLEPVLSTELLRPVPGKLGWIGGRNFQAGQEQGLDSERRCVVAKFVCRCEGSSWSGDESVGGEKALI